MKDTTSAGVVDEVKFSPTDGKGDSGEEKREGEGRGSEGDRQGAGPGAPRGKWLNEDAAGGDEVCAKIVQQHSVAQTL